MDGSVAAQSVSESVLRAHSQTEVPTQTKGSITFHKSHCRRTRKLRDRIGLHSGLSGKKPKGGNFAALFFVRWFGCNVLSLRPRTGRRIASPSIHLSPTLDILLLHNPLCEKLFHHTTQISSHMSCYATTSRSHHADFHHSSWP